MNLGAPPMDGIMQALPVRAHLRRHELAIRITTTDRRDPVVRLGTSRIAPTGRRRRFV